jgi:hypothetical protein
MAKKTDLNQFDLVSQIIGPEPDKMPRSPAGRTSSFMSLGSIRSANIIKTRNPPLPQKQYGIFKTPEQPMELDEYLPLSCSQSEVPDGTFTESEEEPE